MTDDVAVSTEIQVDDETRAALLLFNERVEASAAEERGKKKIAKAERAKDEAAKEVRRVTNSDSASAEDKAEAEAKYKEASDHYQVVLANPLADDKPKKPAKEPAAAAAEPALTEVSADEEAPAPEEASPESE